MKISMFLLAGCALAASSFVTDKLDPEAAGMSPVRLSRIRARMKEYVDAGKTAGVVTLVARHGKVAAFDAVGYQDLESKTPMKTDTIFRIASVTKPITCAGIMTLVDEGRISVIDPVEKFLPEFKGLKMNPCGTRAGINCAAVNPSRPVNLMDLMTHTSGLPGAAPAGSAPPSTLAESVARVSRATLLFEPRDGVELQQYRYRRPGTRDRGRLRSTVRPIHGGAHLSAASDERHLLLRARREGKPRGLRVLV